MVLELGSPGPPSQLFRIPSGAEPSVIFYRMVRIVLDLPAHHRQKVKQQPGGLPQQMFTE